MKRFWLALLIAVFFYTKIDILIWQRIFEENRLTSLGIGVYHWGWLQSLFGFMTLGILICYPDWRRMFTFPISLAILAFSGLEDVLYYWLDGKNIPTELPWLNTNPLLIKPVTVEHLLISAILWILFVVGLDILGGFPSRALRKTSSKILHAFTSAWMKTKKTATSLPASTHS
jgi:hypothetical protein